MMSDKELAVLAGLLLVVGGLLGGLILVSGVLNTIQVPNAETLMAIGVIGLVPATLLLVVFLIALGRSS